MKFGIIGLGNHAIKSVMPAIKISRNQILSIYSRSKKRAEEQAIRYGSDSYDDLNDILKTDVDAFYIASPNALHFEHARLALENGKHVLLEKPMTLRYSEATDLVRLAEKEDLALGVGFHLRLHPAIEDIKNAIDAGVIGNITLIEAAWTGYSGGGKRTGDSSWWEDPDLAGGGSITDSGVHVMDCLNNIMRSYPDRISSIRFPHGDIIDITSSINLQYGATIAHAVSSRNVFLPENSLKIFGDEGSIEASNLFTTEINSVVNVNGKRHRFSSGNIYRKEIDAFVDLVENRPTSIARGVDGAAVVRMTEGAIQSDMSGRTVELAF